MPGEKTEKPTAQKKKQGRKEGQVARTPDLGAWAGMFAASIILPMVIRGMLDRGEQILRKAVAVIAAPDPAQGLALMGDALMMIAITVGPLAIAMLFIGFASGAAQGGLNFATKLMVPKFSRLNPLAGLKKTFGPHAAWEAVKSVVKTGVLGAVLYYSAQNMIPTLMSAGQRPLLSILGTVGDACLTLIRTAAGAGLVMAAADYFVVKRRIDKQLRMSKQDIKDEYKKSEGDPQLKGQIRGRQLAMSRNRMMQDVPKADAVIVNPTHFAVALRYDPAKGAPRVVAKGAGTIAAKIKAVAAENRIAVIQDQPLARTLYKGCEIGQEIPAELYGAVATVLAFVMSLKAKGAAAGTHRVPQRTR